MELGGWLKELELDAYLELFEREALVGKGLSELTDKDRSVCSNISV